MYDRLQQFLSAEQAEYETLGHDAAVTAQEQAAAMHVPGDRVAKVLVVKERDGYVLAAVPATTQVDLDRLKGLIGHDDVRLATVEETRAAVPDCVPGAIPPFGALYGLRSFVDHRLFAVPEVTMPAGDPASAIRMRAAEFRRVVNAVEGDFAISDALIEAGGVARGPRARGRRLGPERPAGEERAPAATTRRFYRTVMDASGAPSLETAQRTTAAVFHALRDRLSPEEADHAAAQLPRDLQTIWAEGERAERRPVKMDRGAFCARVKQEAVLASDDEARKATLAVFAALKARLSSGEAADVLAQLPTDLKTMWADAA